MLRGSYLDIYVRVYSLYILLAPLLLDEKKEERERLLSYSSVHINKCRYSGKRKDVLDSDLVR